MQLRGSKQAAVAGGAVVAALALAACSSSSSRRLARRLRRPPRRRPRPRRRLLVERRRRSGTINASGSTFQTNFQQAAIQAFKTVQPGVTVNYGGGGSGAGRTALYAGTVLFAGSDSPIPASEKSKVPTGKTVLYFPVQIGPIAMAYNLSGVSDLKLDATVLAGIFQGTIKTWNDPAIKALNSGASLPSTPITLVGPLGLLRHHRQLLAVPGERGGQRLEARHRLHDHLAVDRARRQRRQRRGAGHQVHLGRDRLRGRLHRHGLRAERRLDQEQGRRLRRAARRRAPPRPRRRSRPRPT